ncbi:MAG: 50S ribosomal protein L22 [Candidatus Nanoarchaeia archaeon]|nr:50S ribosomal protein L22 [Candidatus Nanoarchaeia archaeon]MDD5239667.1 50S ribosomal protein L22 [Candidatus Nanoarchaeia archaeon]
MDKLEARQEKAKEMFEEKAKEKKEEAAGVAEEKKEAPKKKKVEIKKPVVTEAKGYVEYAPISTKTSVEVARSVRGKPIKKVYTYLDEVIAMKKPVRYYRFNKEIPHRRGEGFGAGQYPIKVAKVFKEVIRNAVANAQYLNLDPDKLYIKAAVPNRAISRRRQGRYTNLTITVAEIKEEKKK